MPPAKNQDFIPNEDLRYFIAATTANLRNQLREADLNTAGLKYDLYQRLIINGHRLYNDDREDDSSEDDDSEDEDSDHDDAETDNDGPNNPPSGNQRGRKRTRDDDGDDIDQPPARRSRGLTEMPVELNVNIIDNLDAGGVFNLVSAAPREFLLGGTDAFLLEARNQRNNGTNTRVSLLEWVSQRAANEVEFRTSNRDLIQRVVRAYVETYPNQGSLPEGRVENMLGLLREVGVNPVLGQAVRQGQLEVVHLLILMGEDVNQRVNNVQPLELAATLETAHIPNMKTLQIIFALIAGGADTTNNRLDYTAAQASTAFPFVGVAEAAMDALTLLFGWDQLNVELGPANWPPIMNPRGLTIRQFLADERSPFDDRSILALILIMTRGTTYPNFRSY